VPCAEALWPRRGCTRPHLALAPSLPHHLDFHEITRNSFGQLDSTRTATRIDTRVLPSLRGRVRVPFWRPGTDGRPDRLRDDPREDLVGRVSLLGRGRGGVSAVRAVEAGLAERAPARPDRLDEADVDPRQPSSHLLLDEVGTDRQDER